LLHIRRGEVGSRLPEQVGIVTHQPECLIAIAAEKPTKRACEMVVVND